MKAVDALGISTQIVFLLLFLLNKVGKTTSNEDVGAQLGEVCQTPKI